MNFSEAAEEKRFGMIDDSTITTVQFSTDELPEKDRIACWREHYGQLSLRVDIEPAKDAPFDGCIISRTFPGLQLMEGRLSAAKISRTREFLSDGSDDLVMTVNRSGAIAVSSCGREVSLGQDDAILMTSAEVTAFDRPTTGGSFSLCAPRSALSPLVVDVESAIMRPIPHHADALRLLCNYAEGLFAQRASMDPSLRNLAVSHVHDLMALTLGATRDATENAMLHGVRAAKLRLAKTYIMQNSHERDMSVGKVAGHLAATPRYVQRLFESDGCTFSEFLLGQRLSRAHRMLCEPSFYQHAVSAIAYDVGFGDLSYFNRSFRRVYGLTPRDVRANAK